jgi:hypothetical protein
VNALEAKARQERFAALVAGDPLDRQGVPMSLLSVLLNGRRAVRLDDVVQALGQGPGGAKVDRNRIAHHLYARGYAPTEADPGVFELCPWHTFPWPEVDGSAQ